MKKIPPRHLTESFNELYGSMWKFGYQCKQTGVSPDICMSMIICCFLSMFNRGDEKLPQQEMRDMLVASVNKTLEILDRR